MPLLTPVIRRSSRVSGRAPRAGATDAHRFQQASGDTCPQEQSGPATWGLGRAVSALGALAGQCPLTSAGPPLGRLCSRPRFGIANAQSDFTSHSVEATHSKLNDCNLWKQEFVRFSSAIEPGDSLTPNVQDSWTTLACVPPLLIPGQLTDTHA